MRTLLKLFALVTATLAVSLLCAHGAATAVQVTGTTRDPFGAVKRMTISIKPSDSVILDNPYAQVPLLISTNSATDGTFTVTLLPGSYQWTIGNTRPFWVQIPTNAVGPYNIADVSTNAPVNIWSTNTSGFALKTDLNNVSSFTNASIVYVATNGNDTTAIKGRDDKPYKSLALAASKVSNNDTLMLMPGIHNVTAASPTNDSYVIMGGFILSNVSYVNIVGIGATVYSTNYGHMLNLFSCTNVEVSGIRFEQTRAGQPSPNGTDGVLCSAIMLQGTNEGHNIHNNTFYKIPDQGVSGLYFAVNQRNIRVTDNYFQELGVTNTMITAPTWADGAAVSGIGSGWIIENNKMFACQRGIELQYGQNGSATDLMTNVVVRGNTMVSSEDYCIMIDGAYDTVVIDGNTIIDNVARRAPQKAGAIICISGTNISIGNNFIRGVETIAGGIPTAILLNRPDNCNVYNNEISDVDGAGVVVYGISIYALNAGPATKVTIQGNVIHDFTNGYCSGIFVNGESEAAKVENITITGNTLYNITSGGSDIWTPISLRRGSNIVVIGNTTFDTAWPRASKTYTYGLYIDGGVTGAYIGENSWGLGTLGGYTNAGVGTKWLSMDTITSSNAVFHPVAYNNYPLIAYGAGKTSGLTVTSNGFVGIGLLPPTKNPFARLHVNGDAIITNFLWVSNMLAGGLTATNATFYPSAGGSVAATFGGVLLASNVQIWPSNYATVPLNVYNNAGASAFTVNSNGNVGVLTTVIFLPLHVNGSIMASNNAAYGDVGIYFINGAQKWRAEVTGSDLDQFRIYDVTDSRTGLQIMGNGVVSIPGGLHSTNSIGTTVLGEGAAVGSQMTNGVATGSYAGQQSINSYNSVFDGFYAGQQSINSYLSVFDGYVAGYQSSNSYLSVFDGSYAGQQSSNSYNSVFDGSYAGQQSINSYNSVFDGSYAGQQSINSYNSVFDGYAAGYLSINSYLSVFDGYVAGYLSSNSYNCVFLGPYSGTNTVRPYTLLIDAAYKGTNALVYGEFDTPKIRFNGKIETTNGTAVVVGLSTNVNVIIAGVTTNQLQFVNGLLIGVLPIFVP